MIFAVSVPEKRELVVYGGTTLREQKEFVTRIEDENPSLIQDTDFSRFIADADLANFKATPTILEFPTSDDLNAFVAENEVELTNFVNAHDRQKRMLALEEFNMDTGGRTLGEIHGLDKHDPWDRRTDEEKAAAEAQRQKMKDKAKSGDMTGDSWGGGRPKDAPEDDNSPMLIPEKGVYYAVTVNGTMGNTADDIIGRYKGAKPLFHEDVADDVMWAIFKELHEAQAFAAQMQDEFTHVAGVDISRVDEKGKTVSGGLNIRDIKVKLDEDGNVIGVDVMAEKDLFGANMYHLTVYNNGEPSKQIEDYQPLLKAAGLAETDFSLGHAYETHEDGGIIIHLGGAATVRMNDALEASGREYTLKARIHEKEGHGEDNAYKIADDQLVSVYFRVDVRNRTVAQVEPILIAHSARSHYRSNDVEGDCWFAYVRRADAEHAVEILVASTLSAELVEVDHLGQRMIEEGAGAQVVDSSAPVIEPPAPWNDRAGEFNALDEKEQRMAMNALLPHLLYTMRDYGAPHRIIVHITPKSYFNQHGKMWEGDLPLEGILPDNFEKFGEKTGVYQCKSLDMNTADFMLGNKGKMKESLNLRAHLNELGSSNIT